LRKSTVLCVTLGAFAPVQYHYSAADFVQSVDLVL